MASRKQNEHVLKLHQINIINLTNSCVQLPRVQQTVTRDATSLVVEESQLCLTQWCTSNMNQNIKRI